jgi:predicted acylesterase/phospholipase RssA
MTMMQGQPGFFAPRTPNPWLSLPGAQTATSYYDTSPLRETLEDLVDFSMINEKQIRFSVGAVNVLSGNFVYFDNATEIIGPEHVMASGALPPALPMVKIGTDHFWDGGIVSNTPLQHLLDQEDRLNTLIFQIDLFSARGVLPRDLEDVMARHKDIMYSSRTRYNTDVYRRIHTWKKRLHLASTRFPRTAFRTRSASSRKSSPTCRRSILQMIYQQKAYEGHAKDHEFRHLDARALAVGLRGHQARAAPQGLADHAAPRRRPRRPRRAPRRRALTFARVAATQRSHFVIPGPPQAQPGIQVRGVARVKPPNSGFRVRAHARPGMTRGWLSAFLRNGCKRALRTRAHARPRRRIAPPRAPPPRHRSR